MSNSVQIPEGSITSEALAKWVSRVGVTIHAHEPYNSQATRDAIIHYADGIGDDNPLWRDENFAIQTSYGRLPAPPGWVYSATTGGPQGLAGVHGYISGAEWTFFKPVLEGDTILGSERFGGFEVKPSKFSGKTVFSYQYDDYHNQNKELVAQAKAWVVRAERRTAREKGKYSEYQLPHPWTEKELVEIEEQVLSHNARTDVLFWEDVEVGDSVPTLVKGPLGITDMIAFTIACNIMHVKAFKSALKEYSKHRAWAVRDPETFALEPMYTVHYHKGMANAAGLPYPYDVGSQRHLFLNQCITDYIGPEGWLKQSYAQYRGFFFLSDVIWIKGKVVKKYLLPEGEHCIDVELHSVNQRGEDIMPGYCTALLPSKNHDYYPVKRLLSSTRS